MLLKFKFDKFLLMRGKHDRFNLADYLTEEDMSDEKIDVPLDGSRATCTNFRLRVLRTLRQTCHIDEWKNTVVDRKILKKKIITICKSINPSIRSSDIYSHADIIVELFFIPTNMDFECRMLRNSLAVRARREDYDRPIFVGSFWDYIWGRGYVSPSGDSSQ
jgi:hypothetical protein